MPRTHNHLGTRGESHATHRRHTQCDLGSRYRIGSARGPSPECAGGMDQLPRLALNPSMGGESHMTCEEGVDQAIAMLQRRGYVT
jgi:hypothetical protein